MNLATKEKEEVNKEGMVQLSDPDHEHKKIGHPNSHTALETYGMP